MKPADSVHSQAPKESPPKESKENKENKSGEDAGPPVPDVGLSDKPPLALNKKAAEDVAGSLKVHIKIALEIDIQITARIKGVSTADVGPRLLRQMLICGQDIAIGICEYSLLPCWSLLIGSSVESVLSRIVLGTRLASLRRRGASQLRKDDAGWRSLT